MMRTKPLPANLQKFKRLPRNRMTMAVGFLCPDGVVIGADTQVTGHTYTFPECKLLNFEWKNGSAILAYAGIRDTFTAFTRELRQRISNDTSSTDKEIRSVLEDCLKASVKAKEVFQALTGYWIDGAQSPSLLVLTTPPRRIVDASYEVIGCADSPLTRSLLGRFRALPAICVNVQRARIYAADFISQAKLYDAQYVGGNINIFSIEDHGCGELWPTSTVSLIHKRENKYTRMITTNTDEWEDALSHIHTVFDRFFLGLISPEGQPSLPYLLHAAKQFRLWATGKPMRSGNQDI